MDGIAEANHDFAEWITSIEADARVDGQRLGSLLQVRCSSVNKERQYVRAGSAAAPLAVAQSRRCDRRRLLQALAAGADADSARAAL